MVQLVEAIIVGFILIGTVFFALAFKTPSPPSATGGTQQMETITWDAVRALNDMYYNDPTYANSTLSKAVADAMAGDPDPLVQSLRRFFPPGTAFNVYLNNGYDRVPVFESRQPTGQTVGISFPFEPRWRYVFAAPDLEVYDSADLPTTMGLNLIPLYNSNLVRDEGLLVRVAVNGVQTWVPGQLGAAASAEVAFTEDAYTTMVQGGVGAGANYPSPAIYLECARELGPPPVLEPCYAIDVTANPEAGYAPEVPDRFVVVVHNDGVGAVPAGTALTVRFPVGFTIDPDSVDEGDFNGVEILGSGPGPQTVKAILTNPIPRDDSAKLRINATNTDERYAFKTVDAQLSGTVASASHFLVRVTEKTSGTYTGGDGRTVLISGPKPSGSAEAARDPTPHGRWAVVVSWPFGPGNLEKVTFEMADGDAVIGDVKFPDDYHPLGPSAAILTGFLSSTATGVLWEPDTVHDVAGYSFREFQFEISTNGVFTPTSPKFPFATPRPIFTGYEAQPYTYQTNPGIWWREEPPGGVAGGMPGFGQPFVVDGETTDSFESRLFYRNALPQSLTTYAIADLTDVANSQAALKDALRSAVLAPDARYVGVGTTLDIELDVADLSTYLAETVGLNNLDMRTEIFAPWGVRDRVPDAVYEHIAASGVLDIPYDIEVAWLDADGRQDVLVASSDGNVYGLAGASGRTIPGKTFSLPAGEDPLNPAGARWLSRGMSPTGQRYGVGTTTGSSQIFVLDDEIDKIHGIDKDEADAETLAVNATRDLTGDGIPEVLAAYSAADVGDANAFGNTRIVLLDGASGVPLSGWQTDLTAVPPEYGYVVNGTADHVGTGFVGPDATDGIYATTGMNVGTSNLYTFKASFAEMMENPTGENIVIAAGDATTISFGVYDSGMVGAYENAVHSWNFTGGRFVDAMSSEVLDTGGAWTGIVAGGGDGWAYGFSGKKAITPVTGFEFIGNTGFRDMAMSNAYEGYAVTGDGLVTGTRDGWTTMKPFRTPILDAQGETVWRTRNHPGAAAVDTPQAPYIGDPADPASQLARVAWVGGDAGLLLRTTDRFTTRDVLTPTGQLHSVLGLTGGAEPLPTFGNLQNIDLTLVNFEDVYAVDDLEAWFVGGGINGTLVPAPGTTTSIEDLGYIVHTVDGGATLAVTLVECKKPDLLPLDKCHLHGIEHDGERVWIVGDYGLILVQDLSGDAALVDFVSADATLDATGRVIVNLDADAVVGAKTLKVDWSPTANLEWMKDAFLNDAGTDDPVWTRDAGALHVSGLYSPTHGAGRAAVLDLEGYDLAVNLNADHNRWDGAATLKLGPFRQTLSPLLPGVYFTNADFPVPTDFTLTVTFEDNSVDVYRVGIGAGSVTSREVSSAHWKHPDDLGFLVPASCFGAPDELCAPYFHANITENSPWPALRGMIAGRPEPSLAVPQASLYALEPDGLTWLPVEVPVETALQDVAMNVKDLARWIAVGNNDRVLATYDNGETWSDMPKIYDLAIGPAAKLRAADFSHPDVGYVFGGTATALMWTLDGYAEWGSEVTTDVYAGAPIVKLGIDRREMIVTQEGSGTARVRIDVQEPDGDWRVVHDPITTWPDNDTANNEPAGTFTVTFDEPTDVVKLRFTLSTPVHGFSRFSPQARGELHLLGWADAADKWDEPTTGNAEFDLNTTVFETGLDTLDRSTAAGSLRLKSVHNPWVYKLGNETGPWQNHDGGSNGARTGAMDLSPDGNTLYLGTEAIYKIGGLLTEAEVSWDNTLYAINVADGTPVATWTPVGFPHNYGDGLPGGPGLADPIVLVRAFDTGVYVVTHNTTAAAAADVPTRGNPLLWRLSLTGTIEAGPISFALEETVHDIEVARIDAGLSYDAVVAVEDTVQNGGSIVTFEQTTLIPIWQARPALKGLFEFAYPVEWSAVYGGYIIETTITWDIQAQTKSQNSVLQTARIHNVFTVTPPNLNVPLSPTYNLEVIAWLQDWG